jgi:glutamyl-tRNA reductase
MMFDKTIPYFSSRTAGARQILMMGASLKNSVGMGKGPRLNYAMIDQLRSVKLSHGEITTHLKAMIEEPGISECWIWNTCNRFCVYVIHTGSVAKVEEQVRERFFKPLAPAAVTTLHNREVVHHLLRTVAGLNSSLPGETDVEQQFQSAIHLSQCVGSIGEEGLALAEAVIHLAHRAREATGWRRFSPSYCLAALDGALAKAGRDDALSGPVVVVGSSNTSRSCVEHLERDFNIPPKQITFYHRCHRSNGQVKSIRRASLGCQRQRVEDYAGPELLAAIADASLVVFGIDRDQPVLHGDRLREAREGRSYPLVILDFNTLGSTEAVQSDGGLSFFDAQQLENEAHEYALKMQLDPSFTEAVDEIETLLVDCIKNPETWRLAPEAPASQMIPVFKGVLVGAGVGR